MAEDRIVEKILKLLQEGKITRDEANRLLHPEKEKQAEKTPELYESKPEKTDGISETIPEIEMRPEEIITKPVKPKKDRTWPWRLLKYSLLGIEGIALIVSSIHFRSHLREYLFWKTTTEVAKYYLNNNTIEGVERRIPFVKWGLARWGEPIRIVNVWGRKGSLYYEPNDDNSRESAVLSYKFDKQFMQKEAKNVGLYGGICLAGIIAGYLTTKIGCKRKNREKERI